MACTWEHRPSRRASSPAYRSVDGLGPDRSCSSGDACLRYSRACLEVDVSICCGNSLVVVKRKIAPLKKICGRIGLYSGSFQLVASLSLNLPGCYRPLKQLLSHPQVSASPTLPRHFHVGCKVAMRALMTPTKSGSDASETGQPQTLRCFSMRWGPLSW